MEICRNNSNTIKRIVYLSSLAAVGPSPDGQPLDESAPMHPVSHNGESKKRGEMEVIFQAGYISIGCSLEVLHKQKKLLLIR